MQLVRAIYCNGEYRLHVRVVVYGRFFGSTWAFDVKTFLAAHCHADTPTLAIDGQLCAKTITIYHNSTAQHLSNDKQHLLDYL